MDLSNRFSNCSMLFFLSAIEPGEDYRCKDMVGVIVNTAKSLEKLLRSKP